MWQYLAQDLLATLPPPFSDLICPAGKYASTVVTGVKYDKAVATGYVLA
jgi:hypothetical protein